MMEISSSLWAMSKNCTMLVWWFDLCFLKNSLGLNLIQDAAWSVPSSSGEVLPSTGFQGPPRPCSATKFTADMPCCPPGLQPFCPDQGPHSLLGFLQPWAGHILCSGCAPGGSWHPISAFLLRPLWRAVFPSSCSPSVEQSPVPYIPSSTLLLKMLKYWPGINPWEMAHVALCRLLLLMDLCPWTWQPIQFSTHLTVHLWNP